MSPSSARESHASDSAQCLTCHNAGLTRRRSLCSFATHPGLDRSFPLHRSRNKKTSPVCRCCDNLIADETLIVIIQ
eukprot:jgi/Botrbrau1/1480/Bobra.178_3s0036.1